MDNDNLESFLKPKQFSSDSPLYKKWSFQLVCSCLLASLASFQFGYNIAALNLITPNLKEFFNKSALSPLDYKLKKGVEFYLSKEELYTEKRALLEQRERQLEKARWIRENYFDILMSANETAIKEAKEYIENRTREVKLKYNMTLEQFFPFAEKLLEEKRGELAAGRNLLDKANQTIKLKTNKLKYYKSIISDMSGSVSNLFFIIGGLIGACTSKYPIDKFGYKYGILFHYLFAFIAELCLGIPNFFSIAENLKFILVILFLISRLFYGIQGGMSCTLVPSYINEISPVGLRKSTGIFHSVFLSLGIFISHLVGYYFQYLNMIVFNIICCYTPLAITLNGAIIFVLFSSNSPRVLIENKNEKQAIKELTRLRNTKNVDNELQYLSREISMQVDDKLRFYDLFNTNLLKWPLFTSVLLQIAQQFSGINAIFFYSYLIFDLIGLSKLEIQYAIMLAGFINFLSTLMISPLVYQVNRKLILIANLFVIIINFGVIVVLIKFKDQFDLARYLCVGCIMAYLICFAASLGPIPFLFVNDVFQKDARSAPTFVCILVNWICALLVALNFELLLIIIKEYVFVIFGVICFFTLIIVILKMPVEAIQNSF